MTTQPAKIDPTLKSKWVAALRSGDFQQGTSFFENNGKFCCLGVLCVVAEQPPIENDCGNWRFAHDTLGTTGAGYSWASKLATMNDRGQSFRDLARFIEREM
jgi:hypothetical protein